MPAFLSLMMVRGDLGGNSAQPTSEKEPAREIQ
jgi:hypothetical protein